jgi:hypothetical protein
VHISRPVNKRHDMNKTLVDYFASSENMRANLDLHYGGAYETYRVVAVELRKLLCDTNYGKDISLLPRVFPDLKLLRLEVAAIFDRRPEISSIHMHYTPTRLAYPVGELPPFGLQFDETGVKLGISDWVNQPFFSREITMKELIKSVADMEAAHSEEEYKGNLRLMRKFRYNDVESQVVTMLSIGEYLLRTIDHEKPTINPGLLG